MTTATEALEQLARDNCVPQPASHWTGDFPLPPTVERYYAEVGPCNVQFVLGGGNPTNLPSLASLSDWQIGHRFHGQTGERIAEWPDDWLVVGVCGGEAYIYEETSNGVLHALPGAAVPGIPPLFDSLYTMAAALGALENAPRVFPDEEFHNHECEIRPMYREPLIQNIVPFVGSEAEAARVLDVLGYWFAETDAMPPEPTADELEAASQRNAESRSRGEFLLAIRESDTHWQSKNYRAVVDALSKHESELDKLHLSRLAYCRKKLK